MRQITTDALASPVTTLDPEGVQPALCIFSGGGLVAAHGVQAAGAIGPEPVQVAGFTQRVGCELQEGLGALVPKLLAPFHAAVDLLDGRLDVTTGDRQT